MATPSPYSPLRTLQALVEGQVAFIVIGGVAANVHGSTSATFDLDICYERSRPNLEALASVLQRLHATLRGVPPDLPFRLDARTLDMGDRFTFSTDTGALDCLGTPGGTQGYTDLVKNAVNVELEGLTIKVASLDDLIRMKRAAGRPKDRVELEILGALRDVLDGEEAPR